MPSTTAEPQHLTALRRANEVRLARAATRRELRTSPTAEAARRRCAELLEHPPAHLATTNVVDLLAYCHRMGPTLARQVLRRHRVGEHRVVGQLTDRQREALARDLRGELDHQAELPWGVASACSC